MIAAYVRVFLGLAGAGVGLAALLLGAGAWALARGPVPLAPLIPRIERAIAEEWPEYRVSLGDLAISAGAGFAVGIRAFDVRAARADGALALRAPEAAVSLSALALARGEVAPRRIALAAPVASVRGGGLRTALAEAPGGSGFGARLRAVDIAHATVVLEDGAGGERVFTIPHMALRRESNVLRANARLSTELEGETLAIDVAGRHDAGDGSARVAASFVDLTPARLAGLGARIRGGAAQFDAPLSGEIAFARRGGRRRRRARVRRDGRGGRIRGAPALRAGNPLRHGRGARGGPRGGRFPPGGVRRAGDRFRRPRPRPGGRVRRRLDETGRRARPRRARAAGGRTGRLLAARRGAQRAHLGHGAHERRDAGRIRAARLGGGRGMGAPLPARRPGSGAGRDNRRGRPLPRRPAGGGRSRGGGRVRRRAVHARGRWRAVGAAGDPRRRRRDPRRAGRRGLCAHRGGVLRRDRRNSGGSGPPAAATGVAAGARPRAHVPARCGAN